MSETANVDEVQARFIKEIEERGIGHVLEWISGWYSEFAGARLNDNIERAMGEHRNNREGLEIFLKRELTFDATQVAKQSTQVGANLLRQATVAEVAERLHRMTASKNDEAWSTFCQQTRDKSKA